MSKGFQQAGCDQHSNLVHFKAEKPSGLDRIETSRGNLPTQKLRLLCNLVHTTITAITDQAPAGVSNTPKQLANYPVKTQPVHRIGVLPQRPSDAHGPSSFATGFNWSLLFRNLLLTFIWRLGFALAWRLVLGEVEFFLNFALAVA